MFTVRMFLRIKIAASSSCASTVRWSLCFLVQKQKIGAQSACLIYTSASYHQRQKRRTCCMFGHLIKCHRIRICRGTAKNQKDVHRSSTMELHKKGAPEKLIQERTRHRSLESLRTYERTSEEQHKERRAMSSDSREYTTLYHTIRSTQHAVGVDEHGWVSIRIICTIGATRLYEHEATHIHIALNSTHLLLALW